MIPRRRAWLLPIGAWVLGAVLALVWLRATPHRYAASMTVAPLAERGLAGMGARLPAPYSDPEGKSAPPGQEEGLTDFRRFLALLGTRSIAAELAADPTLMTQVFPEEWDGARGRWHPPGGLGPWFRGLLATAAGRVPWHPPDAEDLARHLRDRLVIEPVGTTPMRRIAYRHESRDFALLLLSRLYSVADAHLRAEAARRGTRQADHVRARLASVTQADHRRSLTEMLLGFEWALMLLEVDLPFAADLVEAPQAPSQPESADAFLMPPVAGGAGFAIGALALGALRRRGHLGLAVSRDREDAVP